MPNRVLIRALAWGLCIALTCKAPVRGQSAAAGTQGTAVQPSKPSSPDDGWPDLSGFLDKKYGFLPVGTLITEPSVGLGAAGGLAFIDKPFGAGRPDISLVGGMGTENGTKGAFAGDMRHWFDGRLQTRAALLWASVNLDFYGVGEDPVLADNPLRYNLEPAGGLVDVRYRFGSSSAWAGVSYAYARTLVAFDAPSGTPGLPSFTRTSTVGGLGTSLAFDSRDNLFTPTRGTYVEGILNAFSEALGGDDDFQRAQIIAMQYVPLPGGVFLGVRGQATASSDGTPFYLRPFVYQRGVPAMRYFGETMAQIEAEIRWQFWNRMSVVGFGGTGTAWTSLERADSKKTVSAGGAGLRYELARRYGMHVGADVAYGPDGAAFYLQWGSAWIRP